MSEDEAGSEGRWGSRVRNTLFVLGLCVAAYGALPVWGPKVPPRTAALQRLDQVRVGSRVPTWTPQALVALGPEIVPDLVARLDHPEVIVRSRAEEALCALGPRAAGAIPALIERAVRPKHPWDESSGMTILHKIGAPAAEALAPLLIAAEERQPVIAEQILRGMGPVAIPALRKASHVPETAVRAQKLIDEYES